MTPIKHCRVCGVKARELHEMLCTIERCPFCTTQLAGCGCAHEVLRLTEEERRVLDEYIDDSVEPLKSIVERWITALQTEGRVPFQSRRELEMFGVPLDDAAD